MGSRLRTSGDASTACPSEIWREGAPIRKNGPVRFVSCPGRSLSLWSLCDSTVRIPSMSSKSFAFPRKPSLHASGLSCTRLTQVDRRKLSSLVKRLTLVCGAQSAKVVGCASVIFVQRRTARSSEVKALSGLRSYKVVGRTVPEFKPSSSRDNPRCLWEKIIGTRPTALPQSVLQPRPSLSNWHQELRIPSAVCFLGILCSRSFVKYGCTL